MSTLFANYTCIFIWHLEHVLPSVLSNLTFPYVCHEQAQVPEQLFRLEADKWRYTAQLALALLVITLPLLCVLSSCERSQQFQIAEKPQEESEPKITEELLLHFSGAEIEEIKEWTDFPTQLETWQQNPIVTVPSFSMLPFPSHASPNPKLKTDPKASRHYPEAFLIMVCTTLTGEEEKYENCCSLGFLFIENLEAALRIKTVQWKRQSNNKGFYSFVKFKTTGIELRGIEKIDDLPKFFQQALFLFGNARNSGKQSDHKREKIEIGIGRAASKNSRESPSNPPTFCETEKASVA